MSTLPLVIPLALSVFTSASAPGEQAAPALELSVELDSLPTEEEQVAGLQRAIRSLDLRLEQIDEQAKPGKVVERQLPLIVPGAVLVAGMVTFLGLEGLKGSGSKFLERLGQGLVGGLVLGFVAMLVTTVVNVVDTLRSFEAERRNLTADRQELVDRLATHGAVPLAHF